MNSLLASIVGFLNGFLALLFIIGGAIIGDEYDPLLEGFGLEGLGLPLGLIIGVILAIVVCGILAIFVSMRNELMAIRRLLDMQSQ